jgi:alpha-L-rhamnosidase
MALTITTDLRFEHYDRALGIGERTPRLSWKTTAAPEWQQAGYELELRRGGHVASHRIAGGDQILVPWPDRPLASRERVEARVRVYGQDGIESPWSEWVAAEAGLLEARDWTAVPVSAPWAEDADSDRRPALVRTAFTLGSGTIAGARLYASAHGLYEAEINGTRVGDDILSPGWTVYGKRLRYYTYDVTEMLRVGENALGAWLADGWYRGRIGFNGGRRNLYGTDQSFIAQLEITYADGSRETVATGPDGNWRAAFGPILVTSLYDGEDYDQRQEQSGWSLPGFDDASWEPVRAHYRDPATLVAAEGPPIRCTEELVPQSVTTSPSGKTLLDFGQNMVGRLRIRVSGTAGDSITLRHAEVLQDGELYTRPLREARSTDILTLSGEDTEDGPTVWEPRFAIHGFRYVEVSGWPGGLDTLDVTARVYHSDMRRTGWFECSDPLVNRLHENIRWSMRGNFVDIPTDCPQRDERLGWTGDIQVFAPTASFLYDCSGMLSSWLRDVALEQHDDGTVPWYVPVIPGGDMWTPVRPGAVWGDAAVLTPWVLHEQFGDPGVLVRQYDSAKAWVDLVDRLSGPSHLWNKGFQLGDWLDPNAPPEDPAGALTDKYLVATAYFALSARRLGETARVLGKDADAKHYLSLAADVREAFTAEYCLPDGRMTSDAQTAYALAINFELITDPELLMLAGKRLRQLVEDAGNRIATGFAGTPAVCDALTATGNIDTAYGMLLEKECPSWLYTVEQGGTTIWERWDSLRPDGTVNPGGMTSFNHYALGAVADWMHRKIGGIAPMEPGYRRISIAPVPGGGMTYAEATLESPYGRISSRWDKTGDDIEYRFSIPTGTSAVVSLPGLADFSVGPGTHIPRRAG